MNLADPAPESCGPRGCTEVRTGCRGSSGVAWELSTTGATEARVVLGMPDDADPATYALEEPGWNTVELTARRPDGEFAEPLPEQRDPSGRTLTLRFTVDGVERLGFELGNWGSCHWCGPSVYLILAGAY